MVAAGSHVVTAKPIHLTSYSCEAPTPRSLSTASTSYITCCGIVLGLLKLNTARARTAGCECAPMIDRAPYRLTSSPVRVENDMDTRKNLYRRVPYAGTCGICWSTC